MTLHLIVGILLFDGREHEVTYELMKNEGLFIRLVELINLRTDNGFGLHRLLLELVYEMARIQRVPQEELSTSSCGPYSPLTP